MPRPKGKKTSKKQFKMTVPKKKTDYIGTVGKVARAGITLASLAYQVAKLSKMINAEKKRIVYTQAGQTIGQVNGNTSGNASYDITPIPIEGVASNQRTGNSIKLNSIFGEFQFYQSSACQQVIHFEIIIFQVKGTPQTPSTFVTNIYNNNQFVLNSGTPAIIDFNSTFNPDFYGTYKIICRKKVTLPPDSDANVTQIKSLKIPLKMNHHIRYSSDGSTVASDGQLILLVIADSGNSSGATASTLTNIPVSIVNSGFKMDYSLTHYYYDN